MYILVLFFPFFSFFLLFFFGRFLGKQSSVFFSILCLFFAFFVALFIFFEVGLSSSVSLLMLYNWFVLDFFCVDFILYFDALTSLMLLVVLSISFFVHLFSFGYMQNDPYIIRFMSYLSLFTFFMVFLVVSDGFIQMFIGWEGVGLCSYLLISFWFTRVLANKAALKAMVMNRIADIFFFFGIIIIFLFFGTSCFSLVFELAYFYKDFSFSFVGFDWNLLTLICFFLFIGAVGKSAQIGLHTWLPDAMEDLHL